MKLRAISSEGTIILVGELKVEVLVMFIFSIFSIGESSPLTARQWVIVEVKWFTEGLKGDFSLS